MTCQSTQELIHQDIFAFYGNQMMTKMDMPQSLKSNSARRQKEQSENISELTVSGEVLVILVFSKLLGLITCKGSGLSQSATQLWPQISAGFVLAEGRVQDK